MTSSVYPFIKIFCKQFQKLIEEGKVKPHLKYSQKLQQDAGVESRTDLNEAQIRQSFILPLIAALGWNQEDPFEVYPEERANGGFIDIRLRSSSNTSLIWEIKRPSVNLTLDTESGRDAAYQGVGYSRTFTDSPYCVVTNFENTLILHSYELPDKSLIGRNLVAQFTWEDLLNEKVTEIITSLTKHSIQNGQTKEIFDKAVENKSIIRTHKPIQDSILLDLEQMRITLIKEILSNSTQISQLSVDEADNCAHVIINRLLFIRCCEDRGIIDQHAISPLVESEGVWPTLRDKVFPHYRAIFNSDIFSINAKVDSKRFKVSDEVIQNVITRTIYAKGAEGGERYDFSIIPVEILGHAYESYLSKRIVSQKSKIHLELKPEIKKSGGVCYTPDYIVDVIAKRAFHSISPDIVLPKVLDCSCGSGAFLIRGLQELIDRRTISPEKKSHQKQFPSLAEKCQILSECIFGVDIDPHAVEITKLSLFLKVMEGETKIQGGAGAILPSMGRNIRHGNSLIDPVSALEVVNHRELKQIKPLDWQTFFKDIGAEGGVDIIIGNPPYIRIQVLQEFYPIESEIYKKIYSTAADGNVDIYIPFIQKGLELLKPNGVLGYICPHRFWSSEYGAHIRHEISSNAYLFGIINFRAEQVFSGVTTYTHILMLKKQENLTFWYSEVNQKENIEKYSIRVKCEDTGFEWFDKSLTHNDAWLLAPQKIIDEILLLESLPMRLQDFLDKTGIFQGLINGCDPAFILEERECGQLFSHALNEIVEIESNILLPILKGSADLRHMEEPNTKLKIIFPYDKTSEELFSPKFLKSNFPKTFKYFCKTSALLRKRKALKTKKQRLEDVKKNRDIFSREDDWYYLESDFYKYSRNQALSSVGKKKIIVSSLFKRPSFFWDESGTYCFTGSGAGGGGAYGMYLLPQYEPYARAILAILSSSPFTEWFRRRGDLFRDYYVGVDEKSIASIPMPDLTALEYKNSISKLDSLWQAASGMRNDPHAKTEISNAIDAIVASIIEAWQSKRPEAEVS